jgi:hypothetical protein
VLWRHIAGPGELKHGLAKTAAKNPDPLMDFEENPYARVDLKKIRG